MKDLPHRIPDDSSWEDLEAIAALVDGVLPPAERDALLARFEKEPALYEIYVDTMKLQEDMEELERGDEAGLDGLPPSLAAPSASRSGWWWAAGAAAVSLLAAALLLAWWTGRDVLSGEELAERLGPGVETRDLSGWPGTRRSGFEDLGEKIRHRARFLDGPQTSLLLGVHHIDLEIECARGRIQQAGDQARYLLNLYQHLRWPGLPVEEIPPGDPTREDLLALEISLSSSDPEELSKVAGELTRSLRQELEAQPKLLASFLLGRWAETGRLLSAAGETAPLRAWAFRRLRDASAASPLILEVETELLKVDRLLAQVSRRGPDEIDPEQLRDAFDQVIVQAIRQPFPELPELEPAD